MSNLLANGHTLLSGVLFDSDRKGIVYLDDIQLEPPTPGLFTLFDDHLHVQVNRWGNTQLSTTFSEPFAGQNAIKAEFPMAWEGFSLRQTQRVSTDEFGALTFAVKGNQSGQNLLVYAIDEDEDIVGTAVWASDYIHGGVLPTDWQVAWIPLRDLMPGGGDFNGIAVEPSVAGTVWLDEVKVVEKFYWPLPEFPVGNHTTQNYDFGVWWLSTSCGTAHNLHTARDFSVGGQVGKVVKAAHNGTVRFAQTSSAWGGYVIIGSQGNAFTTVYTHVTPYVTEGAKVEAGETTIGVTASMTDADPHLHFELRAKPYKAEELEMLLDGVLPEAACGGNPAFPEAFVDPAIEWPWPQE
jgi:murein DD-endopeptidase MepM/ murein hydrolase activator NlpD